MESWHHAWNIMALFIYLSLIHRHLKYLSLNPKSREFKRMYILYIYWKVICMLWLIPTVCSHAECSHYVKEKKRDIYQDTSVLSKYNSMTLHRQIFVNEVTYLFLGCPFLVESSWFIVILGFWFILTIAYPLEINIAKYCRSIWFK